MINAIKGLFATQWTGAEGRLAGNTRKRVRSMEDNYSLWAKHDAEQEAKLVRLPKCSCCREVIQDEYLYEIDGELICESCMEEFRKPATQYIA